MALCPILHHPHNQPDGENTDNSGDVNTDNSGDVKKTTRVEFLERQRFQRQEAAKRREGRKVSRIIDAVYRACFFFFFFFLFLFFFLFFFFFCLFFFLFFECHRLSNTFL
jgi:hypothetical protein